MNSLSLRAAGSIALVTLAALSVAAGGCTTSVAIDGSGGGATATAGTGGIVVDTGPSSGTGGVNAATSTGASPMTTGGGGGLPDGAIAIGGGSIQQMFAVQTDQWLDTGETFVPSTLFVMFGDHPESCGAPVFDYGTQNHQFVVIGLPQALQTVGKYSLGSTDIIAFGHSWLTDGMGNGGGGGGPISAGIVEVLSIDSSSVTVRVSGLFADLAGQNGDHFATICGWGE